MAIFIIGRLNYKIMKLARPLIKQATLFLIVGSLTTALNYAIFFILYKLFSVHYLVSSISGYLAGLSLGYVWNRKYTFKADNSIKKSAAAYLIVNAFSIIFISLALPFLVENDYAGPLFANFVLLIITTIINFFGSKIIAFENKKW